MLIISREDMSKEELVTAHKRIYDNLHGFIRFDEVEKAIIDSKAFQRLHYVRQLGITYLIYPGATHSRFEHSLGVMEIATRIFSRLCKTIRPDLFAFVPRKGSLEYLYWKKILRLAALCHDLGHLPFSHVAERDIFPEHGHEKMTIEVIKSFSEYWQMLADNPKFKLNRNVEDDVIKIAIGEYKLNKLYPDASYKFSTWEKILSAIITGDFFGSDRIDYLLRDAHATGIKYGAFDYLQLIEMLRILPDPQTDEWRMGIDERGLESCEALFLARYFMHKRIYQYAPIKAYNFHLRRFMRKVIEKKELLSVRSFLRMNDIVVLDLMTKIAEEKNHPGHFDAKSIICRQNHYKAIALPAYVTEGDLLSFKKRHGIADDEIEWEFEKPKDVNQDFTFPVFRHHLPMQKAYEASPLLASLPSLAINWLYLAEPFELLFLETIKEN